MARRKRIDPKTIAIVILSILVVAEGYFLFVRQPRKAAVVKKETAVARPAKFPAAKKEEKAIVVPGKKIPARPIAGHIAVIVDDCGYSLQPCDVSATLTAPVTFSVLPDLAHSQEVAQCVHDNGREVMLHLPMEPNNNSDKYPEDYIIKTTMRKTKVERILAESLRSVPYAAGVNNHMGSKATEDTNIMTIILTALKKEGLFFVDSLVTDLSVGRKVASELQVPFSKRDVFLDNINERSAIEKQFAHLADLARKNGYAIGIGHARGLSLQIIKEQTELLEKEGFKFVTVQELINKQ